MGKPHVRHFVLRQGVMCGEVMLAFGWYVIFNSLVGTPVMVRVFRKNFLFGFVVLCLLLVNGGHLRG